ncbi:TniQ family protein, partial [Roseateles sp. P5_E8]
PLFGVSAARGQSTGNSLYLINSGCGVSERVVSFLESTFSMINLDQLTLKRLISLTGDRPLLVSKYRRWCPQCYQNDVASGHSAYDRLLWSVGCVSHCAVHASTLVSACVHCGAQGMQVLTGRDVSGFCPHCLGWLGAAKRPGGQPGDENVRYGLWVSRSIGDLLDCPDKVITSPTQALKGSIQRLADHFHEGKLSHFATQIGRNKSVVSTWLGTAVAPAIDSIVDISYVYRVPLTAVLTNRFVPSAEAPLALPTSARSSRRDPPRAYDNDAAILKELAKAAAGGVSGVKSVLAAAKHLGIGSRWLYLHFPNETKSAARSFVALRRATGEEALRRRRSTLEAAALKAGFALQTQGLRVSRRALIRALEQEGISVRRPEAASLIEMVKQRTGDLRASGGHHAG